MLKKTMPRTHCALHVAVLTAVLLLPGCSQNAFVPPAVSSDMPEQDRSILAGEWQYEEDAVMTLRLDEEGNGTYAWKDGRLETIRLGDHIWVGKWSQRENDREGGFVVKLSPDYTEGEGTWWYVRIGDNRAPAQRGGTFRLIRKTSLTNLSSETPPAP